LDQRALGGNPGGRAGGVSCRGAGGSGFIACFVGGLLLSGLRARHKEELSRGAESAGIADMGGVRGHRGRQNDRPCHLAGVALCVAQPDRGPDASGLYEKLPGTDTIMFAVGWTVLLSVIAHARNRKSAGHQGVGRVEGTSYVPRRTTMPSAPRLRARPWRRAFRRR
jgi:hypothetical protein